VRPSLAPGLQHELRFTVPPGKTVPHLYPESEGFAAMPEVFATGFMVGLVEWACIEAIARHLDEGEISLGVHVDLSHDAATPPGLEVVARVRLERVDGRRLTFAAEADDGVDRICAGRHARVVVDRERFEAGVARKAAGAG
jgi:fluoroacetyl-CoA thioesterase